RARSAGFDPKRPQGCLQVGSSTPLTETQQSANLAIPKGVVFEGTYATAGVHPGRWTVSPLVANRARAGDAAEHASRGRYFGERCCVCNFLGSQECRLAGTSREWLHRGPEHPD